VSFFGFTILIALSLSASGRRFVLGGLNIFPEAYRP
jgi:hypothetical protein